MRLGDDADDYCSRCKLSTTHAIVTLAGEEPQKVRCRTCNHEHNYRRNRGGKGTLSKQQAFEKVLGDVMGQMPANEKKRS